MARRWQSRFNALLSQQHENELGESEQHQHQAAEDLFSLLNEGTGQNNNAVLVRVGDRSTLAGLRSLIQEQLRDVGSEAEEEGDSASEDEGGAIDMEEDHSDEDEGDEEEDGEEDASEDEDLLEFLADENESVTSGRGRNNSVVMEDVTDLVATGQRSADQPRTVSVSSYDL